MVNSAVEVPEEQSRSKRNLFSLGGSFKKSSEADDLSKGRNACAGQDGDGKSASAKSSWMSSVMSKLKGGNSSRPAVPTQEKQEERLSIDKQEEEESSAAGQRTTPNHLAARDGKGNILSEVKQARLKALQQDLLKLVKEAESGGHLKVMRRRSTECISMPGHGVVRLAPPPQSQPAPVPPA